MTYFFNKCGVALLTLLPLHSETLAQDAPAVSTEKPNVILIMCDDLGWGDTGYNGNKIIKTPHLDQMAKEGLQFNRFYAASAVCSPTRASCLTGRNPLRVGVPYANSGHLRKAEITLPEVLQSEGYATGHFGKWHLGTLTHTEKDANRGKPGNTKDYNPPIWHGYDTAFVTESKVPTWDPMKKPKTFDKNESLKNGWVALDPEEAWLPYGTAYWDIGGKKITDNLDGDNSRIIMDRVLPFIDNALKSGKPFLSVIWFHTPHLPCVAGPEYQNMYKDQPPHMRNYAGCITAMDLQIGRLRAHLKQKGATDNTMIWFCSDNGPEGTSQPDNGSAGPFRGRKRDLLEGGVRVPGLLVWPEKIKAARQTDMPCITSDYLPTILDAIGATHPKPNYALDGISLMPLIANDPSMARASGIGLIIQQKSAWHEGPWKLINNTNKPALYNLVNDPGETKDLATKHPERYQSMIEALTTWRASVKHSASGKEYDND